jgi:hypothetical protein
MPKLEPLLEFRLSRPGAFHCSFCGKRKDEGWFATNRDIAALLVAFEDHVKNFHPKGKDFNSAALRIVLEA